MRSHSSTLVTCTSHAPTITTLTAPFLQDLRTQTSCPNKPWYLPHLSLLLDNTNRIVSIEAFHLLGDHLQPVLRRRQVGRILLQVVGRRQNLDDKPNPVQRHQGAKGPHQVLARRLLAQHPQVERRRIHQLRRMPGRTRKCRLHLDLAVLNVKVRPLLPSDRPSRIPRNELWHHQLRPWDG